MTTASELREIIKRPLGEASAAMAMALGMFNKQQSQADAEVGKEMTKLAKRYVGILQAITGIKDGWTVSPTKHLLSIDNEDAGIVVDIHWETDLASGMVDLTVELNRRTGPEGPKAKWRSKFHTVKGVTPSPVNLSPASILGDQAVRRFLKENAEKLLAPLMEDDGWQDVPLEEASGIVIDGLELPGPLVKKVEAQLNKLSKMKFRPLTAMDTEGPGKSVRSVSFKHKTTVQGGSYTLYLHKLARGLARKYKLSPNDVYVSGGGMVAPRTWSWTVAEYSKEMAENVSHGEESLLEYERYTDRWGNVWDDEGHGPKNPKTGPVPPGEAELNDIGKKLGLKPMKVIANRAAQTVTLEGMTKGLKVWAQLYYSKLFWSVSRNYKPLASGEVDATTPNVKKTISDMKRAMAKAGQVKEEVAMDVRGLRSIIEQKSIVEAKMDPFTMPESEQAEGESLEEGINKYDVRKALEAWQDAEAIADSYEEDGDPKAKEARAEAKSLKKTMEDLIAKWEKQKAKSRASSRARAGAMRSVGMVRTRSGQWEGAAFADELRGLIEYKGSPYGKKASKEADMWGSKHGEKRQVGAKDKATGKSKRSGHSVEAKKAAHKGERQAAKKEIMARMKGENVELAEMGAVMEELAEAGMPMSGVMVQQLDTLKTVQDTAEQLGRFSTEFAQYLKKAMKKEQVDVGRLGKFGRQVDAAHSIFRRSYEALLREDIEALEGAEG